VGFGAPFGGFYTGPNDQRTPNGIEYDGSYSEADPDGSYEGNWSLRARITARGLTTGGSA
jgi:hypothetical protein